MSVRKGAFPLLLVLGALGYAQTSQASCYREESAPTVKLNMDVGRVVISPDANVGDVIFTRDFTTTSTGGVNYRCDPSDTVTFKGALVNEGADMGNKVYATNIPGVGIRLSRGGSTVSFTYPGEYSVKASSFSLEGSKFRLELIKTANVTGSGAIASGIYSTYSGPSGSPLLETYLSGNGITIVSPSCKLLSSKVMQVDLPTTLLENFNGVGSKTANKDFSIDLMCSGGVSIAGYANVNTSFSGNTPDGYDKSTGVLVNEDESGEAAKSIGFLVQSGGKPITFGEKYLIGQLQDESESRLSFPMTASYYQYAGNPTAGHVTSHMTYNITYD